MENIRILVPLDFSELGVLALHSAQKMASLYNGTITPFHSYLPANEMEGPYMLGYGSTPIQDYEEVETALHERLWEVAADNLPEAMIDPPIVSVGSPAQAIVEEAEQFDMIVMTTHGRTGFTRFFLGSVSEKVLRTAHIPVLIVNQERELSSLDSILLTTDFSDNSKEAFPLAAEIAEKADARLDLLHIFSSDPQNEDEPDESTINLRKQRLKVLAKEELHRLDDRVHTEVVVSAGSAHEALLNYNLNNPHDLIVMSTVGRTGIDYLMMGSTTANVVRYVKSPLLSINPKKKMERSDQ